MPAPNAVRNRLLAVVTALLVVAGLRWSQPVTMPLAAALFVIAAAWPIKPWLDRLLPAPLSYAGTFLALVVVLGGFCAAVYIAMAQLVQSVVERQDELGALYDGYVAWANTHGFPVPDGEGEFGRLAGLAQTVLVRLYTALGYLGAIAVLVLLGLPEVPAFRRKIEQRLDEIDGQDVFATCDRIAAMVRSYLGVTVLLSLITGLTCAALAWLLGLELALAWGVLNFLLNFIPVIGNILGIVPPALFALLQFGEWTWPLVTFLAYAALQMTISNLVAPWMQGQRLALSPAVVVLALAFWGWVWGVGGVLLAVPLTAALVITCDQFDSTRWIARLLRRA